MAIQRKIKALDPAGTSVLITIVISEPAVDVNGDSYVSLCLLGLDKESHTVFGADAWQAIALAMETARDRIRYFTDEHWKFFWEKLEPDELEHQLYPEDMDESWAET
jgi:hypothetical protein